MLDNNNLSTPLQHEYTSEYVEHDDKPIFPSPYNIQLLPGPDPCSPRSNDEPDNKEEETSQSMNNDDIAAACVSSPRPSLLSVFIEFLLLGLSAWGGPMAQIAMLKQRFVSDVGLVSLKEFNRVQGVYQLIPGPEATELCIYFGILRRGRVGGLLAGLGFILPGSICMLGLEFIYTRYGITNGYFAASFRAIQPAVAAMMVLAVYRIGQHALLDQETRKKDYLLIAITLLAMIQYLLHINNLITIAVSAFCYFLYQSRRYISLMVLGIVSVSAYVIYVILMGFPSETAVAVGVVRTVSFQGLFALGILGGLLSVGGAYTAVPFMEAEATVLGHWMGHDQFLAALALSSMIPAPMVIFSSFVGFIGGQQLAQQQGMNPFAAELIGSTLCAAGMFIPAFFLTIVFHHWLDRLVHNSSISALWDGITACVVGLVAVTAIRFVKSAVGADPLAALIFAAATFTGFSLKHPFTMTLIIAVAAIIGQFFYGPDNY